MVEELKNYLGQLLARVNGLQCISITDRDGVPVLRAGQDSVPEAAMRPSFLSTFGLASDQGSKLGLGKNKTLICMYERYQVIQINKPPLVINFIASDKANTGHILTLEDSIEPLLGDLKIAVAEP